MTRPIAQIRTYTYDEVWYKKIVYVWCPGCESIHPFGVELNQESPTYSTRRKDPIWNWNGSLESPTFSPSLLVSHTVCVCDPGWKHFEICELGDDCEAIGHSYVWVDEMGVVRPCKVGEHHGERLLGHALAHQKPMGSCHSFVRDGKWEFLTDSAHKLAGQTVPLPPIPDWWFGDDED